MTKDWKFQPLNQARYRRLMRERWRVNYELVLEDEPREGLIGRVLDRVLGVRERWIWRQVSITTTIPRFYMPSKALAWAGEWRQGDPDSYDFQMLDVDTDEMFARGPMFAEDADSDSDVQ